MQISRKSSELFICRVEICRSDCLSTDASDECDGDCTLLSVKLDDKSSVKNVRQVSFGGAHYFLLCEILLSAKSSSIDSVAFHSLGRTEILNISTCPIFRNSLS